MADEEWDFVDGLKSTRTWCVSMTCQHFSYTCDQNCHTLLTFGLKRRQVPHGKYLTKRCRNWDGQQRSRNEFAPGGRNSVLKGLS